MDSVRVGLATATGTNPEDWFLTFKARYGMQQVFRALAARGGGATVLTQALTCATAVDPALAEGVSPAYADISAESFAIDPDAVPAEGAWAAVMLQHTFGVVEESRARVLARLARDRGALLIEDSAHALGRMARAEDGTPLADVSIHSFGSEKALPTKFGGAVWVSPAIGDDALRAAIVANLAALATPGLALRLAARTYRFQLAALRRLPSGLASPLRRALTSIGIFEPAVAPAELDGRLAHTDLGASSWVTGQMAAHLPALSELEARRRAAVSVYLDELSDLVPGAAALAGQPLIRMPLLVPPAVDADAVIAGLRARGVYAGDWYRPALFPGVRNAAAYAYREDDPSLRVTRDVIARIINVPTAVSEEEARRVARLVREVTDSVPNARI